MYIVFYAKDLVMCKKLVQPSDRPHGPLILCQNKAMNYGLTGGPENGCP